MATPAAQPQQGLRNDATRVRRIVSPLFSSTSTSPLYLPSRSLSSLPCLQPCLDPSSGRMKNILHCALLQALDALEKEDVRVCLIVSGVEQQKAVEAYFTASGDASTDKKLDEINTELNDIRSRLDFIVVENLSEKNLGSALLACSTWLGDDGDSFLLLSSTSISLSSHPSNLSCVQQVYDAWKCLSTKSGAGEGTVCVAVRELEMGEDALKRDDEEVATEEASALYLTGPLLTDLDLYEHITRSKLTAEKEAEKLAKAKQQNDHLPIEGVTRFQRPSAIAIVKREPQGDVLKVERICSSLSELLTSTRAAQQEEPSLVPSSKSLHVQHPPHVRAQSLTTQAPPSTPNVMMMSPTNNHSPMMSPLQSPPSQSLPGYPGMQQRSPSGYADFNLGAAASRTPVGAGVPPPHQSQRTPSSIITPLTPTIAVSPPPPTTTTTTTPLLQPVLPTHITLPTGVHAGYTATPVDYSRLGAGMNNVGGGATPSGSPIMSSPSPAPQSAPRRIAAGGALIMSSSVVLEVVREMKQEGEEEKKKVENEKEKSEEKREDAASPSSTSSTTSISLSSLLTRLLLHTPPTRIYALRVLADSYLLDASVHEYVRGLQAISMKVIQKEAAEREKMNQARKQAQMKSLSPPPIAAASPPIQLSNAATKRASYD